MIAGASGAVSNLLLIEDNPGDARLVQEALREFTHPVTLHHVKDAMTARQFLQQDGPYRNAPRPRLILLDLNMPRKDGREALREIRADSTLRRIPIVVLTTSKSEEDIFRSYDIGANSFITKPVSFESLVKTVELLGRYWLETVELPPA